MHDSIEDTSVISESLWRAWGHKRKLREQAAVRTARLLVALGLIILLAIALYVFAL